MTALGHSKRKKLLVVNPSQSHRGLPLGLLGNQKSQICISGDELTNLQAQHIHTKLRIPTKNILEISDRDAQHDTYKHLISEHLSGELLSGELLSASQSAH